MTYRCVNPFCEFDYYRMRAICPNPACLEKALPGCGRYFRFHADGTVEKLPSATVPAAEDENVVWLCCYCAMEYEPTGPNQLRIAPDPASFVWRWQIENAEASVAHEAG